MAGSRVSAPAYRIVTGRSIGCGTGRPVWTPPGAGVRKNVAPTAPYAARAGPSSEHRNADPITRKSERLAVSGKALGLTLPGGAPTVKWLGVAFMQADHGDAARQLAQSSGVTLLWRSSFWLGSSLKRIGVLLDMFDVRYQAELRQTHPFLSVRENDGVRSSGSGSGARAPSGGRARASSPSAGL